MRVISQPRTTVEALYNRQSGPPETQFHAPPDSNEIVMPKGKSKEKKTTKKMETEEKIETKVYSVDFSRRRGRLVNADDVAAILLFTGNKFVPKDIDRAELLRALRQCSFWASIISQLTSTKRLSERRNFLERLINRAEALSSLLATKHTRQWLLHSSLQDAPSMITQLVDTAEEELRRLPSTTNLQLGRSPLEWLVGEHLSRIYDRFLDRKTRVSRGSKGAGGPYVRFVQATLAVLKIKGPGGVPHTAETIVRAVTSAKRPPRKAR